MSEQLIERIRKAVEAGQALPGETRPLRLWMERPWYYREQDTWADEAWWIDVARRHWRADNTDQMAALILLANGSDEPREYIRSLFKQSEYNDGEAFWDDVLWLFRDELPWPIEAGDDLPSFSLNTGSPPPELARHLCMQVRDGLRTVHAGGVPGFMVEQGRESALRAASRLDHKAASEWLDAPEINQLHEFCKAWAVSTDDLVALSEDYPLDTAINFGWFDIAELLEANPVFTQAYLDEAFGMGQFMIGNLAARLSALAPGPFAGRWAAYALTLDKEAEVEKVRKESIATARGVDRILTVAQEIQISTRACELWCDEQRLKAAVAWWRCRRHRASV